MQPAGTIGVRAVGAVAAARVARWAAGFAHHGGTSLPGIVGERVDPTIVGRLAEQLGPVALVVGTNGKTTTARLVARILERTLGVTPIANRSGANLRQGIASALIAASRPNGRLRTPGAPAVFEVDELALDSVVETVRPSVVTATNLFRDQLDRYGEVDLIVRRWTAALARTGGATTFVSCADDPRLEALAASAGVPTVRFGLREPSLGAATAPAPHAIEADPVSCPLCGAPYAFDWRSIAHLGGFRCPNGHVERCSPDVAVALEREEGLDRVRLRFDGAFESATADIHLPGISGAYDAAAAVATAVAIGIEPLRAVAALQGATAAFGRLEEAEVLGRRVVLALMKNAASLTESEGIAARLHPDAVLLGLNDEPADGRDPSWIWDVDLAALEAVPIVGVTGSRADDLALRLKYEPRADGREWRPAVNDPDVRSALAATIDRTPIGGSVIALATYTAMLALRRSLERRGAVPEVPR